MRWRINHKMTVSFAAVIGIAAALVSCGSTAENESASLQSAHIDLPVFFQQQIDSLEAVNPLVHKNVQKDDLKEEKQLHIKSWETELSAFLSVDLNKPAYDGLAEIDTLDSGLLQYSYDDPKVDLSCVQVRFGPDNKPTMITVEREIENSLYTTREVLVYEKGEFYLVAKNQKVLLLGNNFYRIEGRFP